jgi:hypothetical protein
MTGPLFSPRSPLRRRARPLLPFTAAILVAQLACTSDQTTEPTADIKAQPLVATSGPHPRARLAPLSLAASRATKPLMSFKASPSLSFSQSAAGEGPSVLILADTSDVSTDALAASLADSGVQVTVRPGPEWTWDGTNPSLNGFDVVIHLNGATYDYVLPPEAQDALSSFVQSGGGFVGSQWNGYDTQPNLSNLVLQGAGFDPEGPEQNCSRCTMTYERLPAGEGHPVLAGLPASFTFPADGHDAGPATNDATPLMRVPNGGPAVLVREFGSGRVVDFSFAANYPYDDGGLEHDLLTLQDPNVQHLYLNAVRWAANSATAVAVPQTITFGPLGNKVYGDPAFSVSASASSQLPVNFTAAGTCAIVGSTVSIVTAGSCTITAHQAGNDAFAPAEDVPQSFAIAKAPSTITFEPLSDKVYGSPAFSISASASSGLPVNFTAAGGCTVVGSTVSITAAGSCTITAHQAGNDSYEAAADVSRSFAIGKASATITVGTEFTYDGTVKSSSITTNPGALSGVTVTYTQNGTPVAQPINAGVYQVVATLDNPNYTAAPATGTLTIRPATPVIEWQPARISVGTPLTSAQLNAVAKGVGGVNLSGSFVYTPPAGTRLKAGFQTLWVVYAPANNNYTGASKSVVITVEQGKSDKPGKKAAVVLKR